MCIIRLIYFLILFYKLYFLFPQDWHSKVYVSYVIFHCLKIYCDLSVYCDLCVPIFNFYIYFYFIRYLEIYNDRGYDLLDDERDDLKKLEDLPQVQTIME